MQLSRESSTSMLERFGVFVEGGTLPSGFRPRLNLGGVVVKNCGPNPPCFGASYFTTATWG